MVTVRSDRTDLRVGGFAPGGGIRVSVTVRSDRTDLRVGGFALCGGGAGRAFGPYRLASRWFCAMRRFSLSTKPCVRTVPTCESVVLRYAVSLKVPITVRSDRTDLRVGGFALCGGTSSL